MKENPTSQPLITQNDLVSAYAAYPGLLEELVLQVFAQLGTPEGLARHNVAVAGISRMISTPEQQRLLWKNVARAIIRTVTSEGVSNDGKDREDREDRNAGTPSPVGPSGNRQDP
jgi:hypothetical protein